MSYLRVNERSVGKDDTVQQLRGRALSVKFLPKFNEDEKGECPLPKTTTYKPRDERKKQELDECMAMAASGDEYNDAHSRAAHIATRRSTESAFDKVRDMILPLEDTKSKHSNRDVEKVCAILRKMETGKCVDTDLSTLTPLLSIVETCTADAIPCVFVIAAQISALHNARRWRIPSRLVHWVVENVIQQKSKVLSVFAQCWSSAEILAEAEAGTLREESIFAILTGGNIDKSVAPAKTLDNGAVLESMRILQSQSESEISTHSALTVLVAQEYLRGTPLQHAANEYARVLIQKAQRSAEKKADADGAILCKKLESSRDLARKSSALLYEILSTKRTIGECVAACECESAAYEALIKSLKHETRQCWHKLFVSLHHRLMTTNIKDVAPIVADCRLFTSRFITTWPDHAVLEPIKDALNRLASLADRLSQMRSSGDESAAEEIKKIENGTIQAMSPTFCTSFSSL